MLVEWEKIQEAFVDERITLEQLFEILIDNYGIKKAKKIIEQNIKMALKSKEGI